jgi:hypothetical protein
MNVMICIAHNMLSTPARNVWGQAHPYDMTLASCGNDPVVRLWRPDGEEMARPTAAQREILTSNLLMLSAPMPPVALQSRDMVHNTNEVEV